MKKISWMMVVVLFAAFVLAACTPATVPEAEPTAAAPAEITTPASVPEASATEDTSTPEAVKPLKVGLSNTFMFPWRAQMIDDMQRVFENYKGRGWVEGELIIQHAGTDVNAQITQIRNMVNDGIDVLLINPISADGLNEVAEEALAKGVLVVAFDQAISAEGVYNVTIDHYTWGYGFADWLCKAMSEEGELAYIEGLPGHPANDDRVRGWNDAIEKYPNIEIVSTAVGNWDNPGAQKAASQVIATNPNLKGILSMDGMAVGVFNALRSAKKLDSIITTGETQVACLKEWQAILEEHPNFISYGTVNPPGIGATALGFAVRLAQGKEFTGEWINGNTYYYAAGVTVDENNFQDFYNKYVVTEGRPDSYYPDEWLSEEDLDALFK
ncbi:MAG: substrate-binding domain-containing protein [Christensenellales bacterium]|jgi:ribose transport system substrate-binding protein